MVYFLNVCSKDDIFAETIQPNDKLLMVGVLGSDPSKSYPLKYLAEVLDHIAANRADLLLVFNFRPAQQILVDRLLSYCNDQTISKIKQNLYQKDIRLFLALLSKCVGLVSNEGGAVNMAKALEVPTFSIYSPWVTKQAWHTLHQESKHEAVHLIDFAPELFDNKKKKEVKESTQLLYDHFKPNYFLDALKNFLNREIPQ